jgi:Protein of unknown function (DUF2934)
MESMARVKTDRTSTRTNGDASSTNPEVKKTSGKAGNGDSAQHSNVEELIRTRAYELFEQRGRVHGHAHEDWLRAETEVRRQFGNRTV